MDVDIEFGPQPRHVTVVLAGIADVAGFARCNALLSSNQRFRAGMTMLIDAHALDVSQLSDVTLEATGNSIVVRDFHYPPQAVAIVASDERAFKALQLLRAHLGGSISRRRIFMSRAEALDWLETQRQ